MIMQASIEEQAIFAFAFIIGGLFLGLILEIIVFTRFRRIIGKAKWKGAEIIVKAFRGIPILWFMLLGCYGAIISIDFIFLFGIDASDILIKILFILFTLSILLILARATRGFVIHYAGKTEGALAATSIVTNLMSFIYLLLGFLIIIQSLGIDITPLLTLLGVGGLTVALALQPTLSNFFAGVYLLASREFKIGDYIKLDTGEEGYITDMTWRHTIIRPPARYDIIIPNAKLSTATVTNFGVSDKETALSIPVGVGYDSNLNFVEHVTIDVALETVKQVQGETPSIQPYIRYHTFSPSSIDFFVNIYSKNLRDRAKIRHEFIKNLFERYKKEEIDIPFPTSVIISKK
ncbi:MAG: mechanosensitive ion channel [Candidatus Heimdallarchaeota archaeon]|nr:MAG: mechanosensitive ion channel [Candidatus Heimdallarchaeota archaeon]